MNILFIFALAFFIIEIVTIPLILKIHSVGFLIFPDTQTYNHVISQIIIHDSLIFLLIFTLVYLSYLSFFHRIISYILRFFAVLTYLIYNLDIYILRNFVTHININDALKYFTYIPKYISQQYSFNIIYIFLIILISTFFIMFIKKQINLTKNIHITFISSIIILILISLFNKDAYVHSWTYKNFIEYNIDLLAKSKEYSNKLKNSLHIENNEHTKPKIKENKNIIVLMVESFASYQSNYFSGIKNWTPNLDKIAKSNIDIKNFYSNGFVTEDAEISIITGLYPIYAPKMKPRVGSTAFQGFYSIKNSLPQHLKKQGYLTEFITSSDLNFSNTGKWAKSQGFDYIEGSKHEFYKDKPRYHFEAVEDKYLFHRVLNRIEKKKDDEKYFIFVKTVSSHIPFINPETKHRSEEETIRYVDKQIGLFYKKLQDTNFFKKGLLIIVGDHHPIIPLKKEQLNKYGQVLAGLRVPLIVSFGDIKQVSLKERFQQVDIYNSIKNYTSSKQTTSDFKGDFLAKDPLPSKYIVYRRGDKRGYITIIDQKEKIYTVKLAGDETRIIDNKQNETTKTIVDKINFERIKRGENSKELK